MNSLHLLSVHEFDEDNVDWDLTCLAVEDACRLWLLCPQCDGVTGEYATFLRQSVIDDEQAHGQHHQIIDGEIMRPTDSCYLMFEPDWSMDSVHALVYNHEIRSVGMYAVQHDYVGDQDVNLTLASVSPDFLDRLDPAQRTALLVTAATG